MKKKIIALLLSAANLGLGGAVPMNTITASAAGEPSTDKIVAEGIEKYLENFESPDIVDYSINDKIQNGESGWKIEETSGNYNAKVWWFGDKDSIALRYAFPAFNLNEELSLDLRTAAVEKEIQNSAAEEEAENDIDELLSNKVALTFSAAMQIDGSGKSSLEDGADHHFTVLDANGNAFMELRAEVLDKTTGESELSLIALNEDMTENVRYKIMSGMDTIYNITREFKVYVDPETNSYRLDINGEPFTGTPFGEWIPASTNTVLGEAAQTDSLSLGKLSIGTDKSNWWGGICLDTISMRTWDFVSFSGESSAPAEPLSLWYRQPASAWRESSPLGNGRIGAMIWGGIFGDTVSLNDITCWSGEDDEGLDNPDGPKYLKELQDEFVKENPDRNKINELFAAFGGQHNETFGTHRPFGRLIFGFPNEKGNVTNYRRSLDLTTAVSTVEYEIGGVKYKREAFVSEPDQVLVMNFSSDSANAISFDAVFSTEELSGGTGYTTYGEDGESLVYNGHTVTAGINSKGKGVSTYARLKADSPDGTVAYENGRVKVENANEATLIIALGTDYMNENGYKAKCDSELANAAEMGYEELKNRHIEDYASLFNRLSIEIDGGDNSEPTDVRIEKVRNGGEMDGSLTSLQYQFARYAMISASRESSPLPMPFVGMWDDNVACNMVWTNDYHMDLNIQMNQWMTNVTNISESDIPIFNYFENLIIPKGKITAKTQYGTTRGWTTSGMSNAWGYTGNEATSPQWHGSTTNGPWMLQEVMNYFDHTWDKDFLRDRGFGMVKDTADFFLDYLKPYTYEGKEYLATIPGASPEHGTLEIMPAMDIAVISDIFTQVLRCYDILEMDKNDGYYEEVSNALSKLAPYRVSPGGALAEWTFNDEANTEMGDSTFHRHTSHLLGLYPYSQITPDSTPELAKAAYNSMKGRFDRDDYEHTEWTCINAQAFYARLKDGDSAYSYLKRLGSTFIWPNLFSYSPGGVAAAPYDIFAIDGTYGMAAATSEMLLQSHSDRLEFLPALPKQWESGRISGIVGRGAFEADIDWKDYKLTSARITSKAGNKCTIFKNSATDWSTAEILKEDNGTLTAVETVETGDSISFDTNEGDVFVIKCAEATEETGYAPHVNDDDPRITYSGSWTDTAVDTAYLGDAHYSETAEDSIELEFKGTGVSAVCVPERSSGSAEVYVDGALDKTVTVSADNKLIWSSGELYNGNHTVKIVLKEGRLMLDEFILRNKGGIMFNPGTYSISELGSGTVLTKNDSKITEKEIEGDLNQMWYIEKVGGGNYSRLINACTGKYLGVNSEGNAAQMEYSNDGSQEWCITPSYRSPGRVVIENKKSGQFLQINMDSYADGAWVSPYSYERADHFEWYLVDMGGGLSAIKHYGSPSLLEVDGNDLVNEGSRVVINSRRASNEQKWNVTALGDGVFSLQSTADGTVIRSDGRELTAAESVSGDTAAMWRFERNTQSQTESYNVVNVKTGASLMDNAVVFTKAAASDAAMPIARELQLSGKIQAGEQVKIKYTYTGRAAESGSEYKAYAVTGRSSAFGEPFAEGTDMSFTVPSDFNGDSMIAVEVIPRSADGKTGSSAVIYASGPAANESFETEVKYSEDFSSAETAEAIAQQKDGWYHYDSSSEGKAYHTVTTDGGMLKMTTLNSWYDNAYAGKTFEDTLDPGTKQYVGFDVRFLDSDNYDPTETKYYVSLVDENGKKITVMYLSKYTLDNLAYNGTGVSRNNIASGMKNIYNNTYRVKIYFDKDANKYAMSVNDIFVRNDNGGIFLTPTEARAYNSGSAAVMGGIKGIELASERFSWNTGMCLDNLEAGSYTEGEAMPWSVTKLDRTGDGVEFTVSENVKVQDGKVYIASYEGDRLSKVKIIDNVDFGTDGIYEGKLNIDIPKNNGGLKIFMWNASMEPIGIPVSL